LVPYLNFVPSFQLLIKSKKLKVKIAKLGSKAKITDEIQFSFFKKPFFVVGHTWGTLGHFKKQLKLGR
jgi:hypothetical protein